MIKTFAITTVLLLSTCFDGLPLAASNFPSIEKKTSSSHKGQLQSVVVSGEKKRSAPKDEGACASVEKW